MAKYFDAERWTEALTQAGWYVRLAPELTELRRRWDQADQATAQAMKDEVRGFFAERLEHGEVALAEQGDDLDEERRPIDTIVIHHTSARPGYALARLNAVHLLNLYMPHYLSQQGERRGRGIWSNHFDDRGHQVFYAYHWLVRMDGTLVQLLGDEQIGWQAGNWEINTRSVGICLDNDYEEADPTAEVLAVVGKLIRKNYPQVPAERILGHCEVNQQTICPGRGFEPRWKQHLIEHL